MNPKFNPRSIMFPVEDLARRSARAQRVVTFLSGLDPKKPWEIVVREYKKPRSGQQNKYLWSIYGFILEAGGEEMGGWTKDDLHEFFLINHFGSETRSLFGRKRLFPLRRSSKLSKQEFSDFVESIMRFMAQRGVYVPSPEDSGNIWHSEAA